MPRRVFLSSAPENLCITRRLVDEIQRLRTIIQREHASHCSMLRQEVNCDCGSVSEASAVLLESCSLHAENMRLEQMAAHYRREIVRLDLALAKSRLAQGTVPIPVTGTSVKERRPRSLSKTAVLALILTLSSCHAPSALLTPRSDLRAIGDALFDLDEDRFD